MNLPALRRLAADWKALDRRSRREIAVELKLVEPREDVADLDVTVWSRAKARGMLDQLRDEVDRERNRLRAAFGGRAMPEVPRRSVS